jgi:agmatinase
MAYGDCRLVLLPFEGTTSYLTGTAGGPAAVVPHLVPASFPSSVTVGGGGTTPGAFLAETARVVRELTLAGEKAAAVGGEHTVTYGVVRGLVEAGVRPTVIQLDAHADLRPEYEGTPWSHACVMRRIIDDFGLPTLAAGIRSLSAEEADFIGESGRPIIFAHQLRAGFGSPGSRLDTPGDDVYLTVDIDFLDPSVMPGTGTPEPGGLGWYAGLSLIDRLLAGRNLVGFDLVEFCPPVESAVTTRAVVRLIEYLLPSLAAGRIPVAATPGGSGAGG